MPLPSDAVVNAWPPVSWRPYAQQIKVADAWYSGDEAKLSALYQQRTGTATVPEGNVRLWSLSKDQLEAEGLVRLHVPANAEIASVASDLLFGDQVTMRIPEAHEHTEAGALANTGAKATEDRLRQLLYEDGVAGTLMEAAELASGLGGVYLRPMWDKTIADRPLLTVIHHDHAVPEFRQGRLVAVTLWSELDTSDPSPGVVWRHLERYERGAPGQPGVVLHGLYKGNAINLGRRGKLTEHPDLAGVVEAADSDGVVTLPEGIDFGVRYIPNRLPNRLARQQPVGLADCAGTEQLQDALDQAYASWLRDIDIGKGHIIVPDEYLEAIPGGRGAARVFNGNRKVFSPIRMEPSAADRSQITVAQFEIRMEEHRSTCEAWFERIISAARYAPQSFGIAGNGSQVTATEVDAREDRSMRTTAGKQRYCTLPLEDVAEHLLIIGKEIFGWDIEPMRPTVVWPDPETSSQRERASTANLFRQANAMSTLEVVRYVHPEWEEPAVKAEAEAIDSTNRMADPFSFGGTA